MSLVTAAYLTNEAWEKYLGQLGSFSFFATPTFYSAWCSTFSPEARVYAVRVDDESRGNFLIPFVELVTSRQLDLRSLIGAPEWGYGICGNFVGTLDQATARLVAARIKRLKVECAGFICDPLSAMDLSALHASGFVGARHEAYVLRLPATYDEWLESLDKRVRRQIRKSFEQGLSTRGGGVELLDTFNELYERAISENPERKVVYPKEFLRRLLSEAGYGFARLYVTFLGQRCVAGGMLLYGRKRAVAWIGATIDTDHSLLASENRFAAVIKDLIEEKAEVLNFGASNGLAGVINFKQKLGGIPYSYYRYEWKNPAVAWVRSAQSAITKALGG